MCHQLFLFDHREGPKNPNNLKLKAKVRTNMQASTAAGVMQESMAVLPTEGQTPPPGCRCAKYFQKNKIL